MVRKIWKITFLDFFLVDIHFVRERHEYFTLGKSYVAVVWISLMTENPGEVNQWTAAAIVLTSTIFNTNKESRDPDRANLENLDLEISSSLFNL